MASQPPIISEFNQPWGEPEKKGPMWSGPPHARRRNEKLFAEIRALREGRRPICTAWRLAAEADGWEFEPTYQHEPLEHAFRGRKEGFVLQGLCRPTSDREASSPSIHIWGPDGLQIQPPAEYDWEAIKAGMRFCYACGRSDVETQRVGFAGRVCADCRPSEAKKIETRGWTE